MADDDKMARVKDGLRTMAGKLRPNDIVAIRLRYLPINNDCLRGPLRISAGSALQNWWERRDRRDTQRAAEKELL